MLPVIADTSRDRDLLSSVAVVHTHIYTLPYGVFSAGGSWCWRSALSRPACYWARTDHLGSRLHIRTRTELATPTPQHRSLATCGTPDLCLRGARESGRTLEEYPTDVGCGLPGCNLTNTTHCVYNCYPPALLLRVEPFRYSGRYRGAHGLRISCVAPVGRLLRRVRITKLWRTLPPPLFTEHLATSASAKARPISASGGGKCVKQWVSTHWRCFTSCLNRIW